MEANLHHAEINTEPHRLSIEDYNKAIDEALAQVKAGNYVKQEDLEKEIETW